MCSCGVADVRKGRVSVSREILKIGYLTNSRGFRESQNISLGEVLSAHHFGEWDR